MKREVLVLDNYDSFTFNLVQMLRQYPLQVKVARSDRISCSAVVDRPPDFIVISPGPKTPSSAGISIELIRSLHRKVPILGVCLGMQCVNEAFGGNTARAPLPVHGKTSSIRHTGQGLFSGLLSPLRVARYHSLAIAKLGEGLEATAWSEDEVIMAISHKSYPTSGVQFHPESFLTEHGFRLIENFLGPEVMRERFE